MKFGDQDLTLILFGAAELDSSFGFVGDDHQLSRSFCGTCPMLSLPNCLCWGWKSYKSQWVVQVRLERLEVRNAIGNDTLRGLQNTFEAVSEDSSANVLLISSKVPKMFCAGADLKGLFKLGWRGWR